MIKQKTIPLNYKSSVMHTPGSIYKIQEKFNVLSAFQLHNKDYAVLISLDGFGNRWVDPIEVTNFNMITDEEMNLISGGDKYELRKEKLIINEHS